MDKKRIPANKIAKNPIVWNGRHYFGLMVDLEGRILNGYTYEQGDAAGWDLYFKTDEDIAWNRGELVYVFTDGKSPKLSFQWGYSYQGGGLVGPSEAERTAKEPELESKILLQIKIDMTPAPRPSSRT